MNYYNYYILNILLNYKHWNMNHKKYLDENENKVKINISKAENRNVKWINLYLSDANRHGRISQWLSLISIM